MPQYTRVHRLLKILTLIQSGGAWTPSRLADECGVAERTIYRDMNALEDVGIPIRYDGRERAYRIVGDFFLPPVQLTPDEALALAVLCEQIGEPEQIAFTRPAWRAMAKIHAAMPRSVRDEIESLSDAIVIRMAQTTPPDGHAGVYERMREAIATRRVLACRYDSLNPDTGDEEFDFEPYALFFSVRAWYAVGHHGARRDVRTLKLNRFTQATLTHRHYDIPNGFQLDDHLGNAWRMIRGETDHNVELHFDSEFAETIGDTLWHRTQRIELHDDGTATFRCTVAGLDEIVWWVLSMGAHCRVIKPHELAERVREEANATARLYQP